MPFFRMTYLCGSVSLCDIVAALVGSLLVLAVRYGFGASPRLRSEFVLNMRLVTSLTANGSHSTERSGGLSPGSSMQFGAYYALVGTERPG